MPTNRRRRRHERRTDAAELNSSLWDHLVTGHPMFTCMAGDAYQTRDELLAAWEQLAEFILPLWVVNYPATRPFGWWLAGNRERRVLPGREEWAAGIRERDRD